MDATCWANGRGYGRFTRELVSAMVAGAPDDEFICFLDASADAGFRLRAGNVRRVVVPQRVSPTTAAGADSARSPLDMLRLSRAVARTPLDVFFSPSVYTYFPLPPGLRAVVTVHDAIAERFPELTLPSRKARLFWNLKVGLALRQARLVLTVSDYAAGELHARLGVHPARIRVTTEAPAAPYREPPDPREATRAAARAGLPPGAPFFAYVGGFNPHKHVDLLVRALARVASDRGEPPHLVLVGTVTADVFHGALGAIRTAIAETGSERRVHWPGFVADDELRHLLAGAVALVLPSASEGFGLPAIEGAACGIPVVATTESPLPRLLEGGGIFVPPGDEKALAVALARLLDDHPAREAMGRVARARALSLTWEAAARSALAAIREAAA